MSDTGWCPFATSVKIPAGNFQVGSLPTLAVALHITNGTLASCISWFKSPASGVSAHFVIGQDGSLSQFVSIHDTAYAQGLSYDGAWYTNRLGEGRVNVSPTWRLLKPGMNINRHVISIENAGKPGEPRTVAHMATLIRLLKWLAEQTKLVYVVGSTLIGHFMLDTVNRAYCPGSAFNLAEIAMAANKPATPDYAALWGGHYPYFVGSGIEQAWRPYATVLKEAVSDETADKAGRVWRLFTGGAVSWTSAGTEVYLPRAK